MLFGSPGKATALKKIIYITASIFLGLILSFIAHAFIELRYLSWAASQNILVTFYGGCALSPQVRITLLLIGVIGGFYLGRLWWRKLYVERTWAKNKSQVK